MPQCQKIGCDSGARWGVELHLPCPEPGGMVRNFRMKLSTEVCDAHRDDVRAMVLADKDAITAHFADNGLQEPDWLNMRVEFVPVVGRDIRVIQMCDREGCWLPATWRIKRRFAEIGRKEIRCEAMTNLVVCDQHRGETVPADLNGGPEERVALSDWLREQGVLMPDLDRTELEFVPLSDSVPADMLRM